MKIEQRHFEFIAETLRQQKPTLPTADGYRQWLDIVNRFAERCYLHNPKFKRSVFMKACGLPETE